MEDRGRALNLCTEILGFTGNHDVPHGEFRWLTVESPDNPDGAALLLEPGSNPAAGRTPV